jgi:tetratricopeptide (TPR) repeat protein
MRYATSPLQHSHNPFFTGRATILDALHAALRRGQPVAVCGPGGIGKTTVAIEYARQFRRQYQQILWLNAATRATLLAGCADLVQQLDLHFRPNWMYNAGISALQCWLTEHEDTLLILDDVTDASLIEPFLLTPLAAYVLLTTRSLEAIESVQPLILEALSTEDGALLLLRRAVYLSLTVPLEQVDQETRLAALQLANEFKGLPLALNLAGAFLRETDMDIQDYLQVYHEQARILEKRDLPGSDPLAAALQVDLTYIAQQCPRAVEILQQCAFLAPHAIPEAPFTRRGGMLVSIDSVNDEANTTTELRLSSEAIATLLAYELITQEHKAGPFDMHPVLQEAVRQITQMEQQREKVEQGLYMLNQYISSLGEETGTADVYSAISHIQQVASFSSEWTLSSQEAADVFGWGAEILYKQENIQEAEPLLRQALPIWERTLGPAHPAIGIVLLNLATLNFLLKNYPQAEFFAWWAVRAQAQASEVDQASIILGLSLLGRIFAEQDKQNEAGLCYRKALALGANARLQGHPFCVTSAYELALLEIEREQFADAEPLLHQVCIVWGQSPDPAYPPTVQAWQAFAEVSCELEKWQQAEECYQRLLPIYEQTLGSEHPETLHCLEQEVIIYKMQDKLDKAKAAMQRLLSVKERTLPPGSLELASCLNDLAEIILVQRQFAEALPLLVEAQKIYEAKPEAEDLILGKILMNLAAAYAADQHCEQATISLESSLSIKARLLGSNHPDLVENLDALALLYMSQNRLGEEETMLQRALEIGERGTEMSSTERATRLLALGQVNLAQDRPERAEGYLQQALSAAETIYPAEPLFTKFLLDHLTVAEAMQGKNETAIAFQAPGVEHPKSDQ